tara:strand:- start:72458 stop:73306 length:849 start_codon:yes stop_codon:yes gene_type:complete
LKYIETISIPVDEIDDTNRLRPLSQSWVDAIAESIAKIGQKEPIEVIRQKKGKPYKLIAGGHRLAGCRKAGVDARAEVKELETDAPGLEAELHEIDENLIRNELNPLDRAVFIGRRQKIYETMYPASKRGGDQGNQYTGGKKRQNEIISFSQNTANAIDLGERTIQRATRIYQGLSNKIRARLAGTHLADREGELYNLTRFAPDDQVKILDLCLKDVDPLPSVKAAGDVINGHTPKKQSAADADFEKLYETWKRCASKKGRTRFLGSLKEMGVIPSFNEEQL